MKNYLVKSLFHVRDTNWRVLDRSHETGMFDNYQAMQDISIQSHKQNLGGTWELINFSGYVDNINQAFQDTFWGIYNLWHQEPCNILYTDPDTVHVKPLDIWNKFDKFMMFNYTDPKQFNSPNQYNAKFDHWFNAGVRYFPASMSELIWDLGAAIAKTWDESSYDTEQIILNTMLWRQGVTIEQALRPDIAYQAHWLPALPVSVHDEWNGISIDKSAIIHLHGSRSSSVKLNLMKQIVGLTP